LEREVLTLLLRIGFELIGKRLADHVFPCSVA
jgi:hypothetical protein